MKMRAIFLVILLGLGFGVNAQVNLGTISGFVYENIDSTTAIPFAKVWVDTESGVRPTMTDDRGHYEIDGLKPGIYNVSVRSVGYGTLTISEVSVTGNKIINVNAYCGSVMETIVIHIPIIIQGDIPIVKISAVDIAHSPYNQDPLGLMAATDPSINRLEGTSEVIIRGSRPGDAIYYIDGVKMTSMSSVPGVAILGLEAYTGGIPAKYGDTTGGVISLETKGYFDLYRAWKYKN